jgi:hypothetical protein
VSKHATSALLVLASVLLAPVAVVLGAITLALILAVAALLSVPALLVLLAAAILNAEVWLVERVQRWRTPPPPDQSISLPPPPPWSRQDAVLDMEYRAQVGYQLEELGSYRNEFLTLTGFLAVIAAATVALGAVKLDAAIVAGSLVNLVLFLVMTIYGKKTLDSYKPDPARPTRLLESLDETSKLGLAATSPTVLRALALQERGRAYEANKRSLDARDHLLSQVRAIIVTAVVVLSSTAVVEALLG